MLSLVFTKFIDLDAAGNEGIISYGYRIFDEQCADYWNMFHSAEEMARMLTKKNAYRWIEQYHGGTGGTYDFFKVLLRDRGLVMNDEWVEVLS